MLGDGGQDVAPLAGKRGQAGPLAAQHQGHRPVAQRQVVEGGRRLAHQAHRPDPQPGQRGQRGGDAAHQGHGEVLDGPGGHLGDRGRQVGGPVPREDDPGDAGALGAAQDGPEVVGVGDAVDDQEEREPPPDRGLAQVLERCLLDGPGQGHHALGPLGAGHRVEAPTGDHLDGDPPTGSQGLDVVEDLGGVHALGQEDRRHRAPAGGQELAHGLAALDLVAAQALVAWPAPQNCAQKS